MVKVCVFLSSYNGEKYIKEQIKSVLNQIDVNIKLVIRDDGSSDNTCSVIQSFLGDDRVVLIKGQNEGYGKSFLKIVYFNDYKADFYAFCDQDDIWLPDKLIRAVHMLNEVDNEIKLYASALQRVDENLFYLKKQTFRNLRITLESEFVRHRLSGATFVFNDNLYNQIKNIYKENIDCSHDKLLTIICILLGGRIVFDEESRILFRRYENNTSIDNKAILYKVFNDINYFISRPKEARKLAASLLEWRKYDQINTDILKKISHYDHSIKDTILLLKDSNMSCGFWYYDLFIKLMIILRRF